MHRDHAPVAARAGRRVASLQRLYHGRCMAGGEFRTGRLACAQPDRFGLNAFRTRGISRLLGNNQVLCGKIMCLGAVALGLLLGSAGLVFPQASAAMAALGCAIAVLVTLGPIPPAQFAFLASYAQLAK